MRLPPATAAPAALLTVLLTGLLAACGDPDVGPAPPAVGALREAVLLEGPAPPGITADAVWVDGEAWLAVHAIGKGRMVVRATLEGQPVVTLVERSAGSATVALPGSGPRAVALELETTGGAGWSSVRLAQPRRAALPAGTELVGALAGRDVLVVVPDSIHAAHVSAYGNERPTTPVLDTMAAKGVRFSDAYSQTSWTLASVTSLFTSVEQERHGMLHMDHRLGAGLTTLAQLFRRAGYRTVGLIQNGVIGPKTGLGRGFERYSVFPWGPVGARDIRAAAEEEIAAAERPPLFLYLHLTPPHMPYRPPARFLRRFVDPDYAGTVDGSIQSCAEVDLAGLPPDHPDVVHLRDLYQAHLAYADAQTGAVLAALHARGGAGPLVVASSDHGEAFLQHGAQGHNKHVFEEMVRVPLILYAPGSALPAGRVVRAPVSLMDVLPTLVELCALPAPRQTARGASLVGLVEGGAPRAPRLLFLSARHRQDEGPAQRGVRLGRHKLVLWDDGRAALYDLERDPGEQVDRSAEVPVLAAALRAELGRWLAAAEADAEPTERFEVDFQRRRALQALGYGGDAEHQVQEAAGAGDAATRGSGQGGEDGR